MDFRRALGELLYKPLLYLRGLRHFVVVNDLWFWQIQLVSRLNICYLAEQAHELRQIKELAEPRSRPIARTLGRQLHRRDRLAEVRRPCVEVVKAKTLECVMLKIALHGINLDHRV